MAPKLCHGLPRTPTGGCTNKSFLLGRRVARSRSAARPNTCSVFRGPRR